MYNHLHYYTQRALLAAALTIALYLGQPITADAATANLAWNRNSELNIAGYRLYYGTASHNYSQQVNAGNLTSLTVSNLVGGTPYFFAVKAYNNLGIESPFSTELAFAPSSQTPTPTPGPSSVNISGNISNCSNSVPDPMPNVTLTRTGTSAGSTVSDTSGNYQFPSLQIGGSYTVTPSKTALAAGSSGISTYDVIAILRHYLGIAILPAGCGRSAADVNGDTAINTTDVVAVQRFFLGQTSGTANVGKYSFSPASRAYSAVNNNQTGQDFAAIVFGDITSPFTDLPGGTPPPVGGGDGSRIVNVALPDVAVDPSVTDFVVQVTASTIDLVDRLVGFQGDLSFDERVISFQDNPVENAGLTGGDWNVSANILPGEGPIRTLRISAYSNDLTPLSGEGPLFNLRMTRVGDVPGDSSPLTWVAGSDQFVFIDVDLRTDTPNATSGNITVEPAQQ